MPDVNLVEGTEVSPQPVSANGHILRPDFKVIVVTLTFPDFDPFVFKFRRQVSADIKKQRQEFYGLTEKQQEERTVEFRTEILASLLIEPPENLPDFETGLGNLHADFVSYFGDPENEELLSWIWSEYQEKLYPKELMSRLSE